MAEELKQIQVNPDDLTVAVVSAVSKQFDETIANLRTELAKEGDTRDENLLKKLNAEAEALHEKKVEELEAEKSKYSLPGTEPTGDEKKDFSFSRACAAIATKNWDNAGYEKEVFAEMRKKVLVSTTDPAAGFMVPEEAIRPWIDILRSKVAVRQLGATILNVTGSQVKIPRQSGSATAYWVAEGVAITASDQTVEQVTAAPHKVAALTRVSNEMVFMGNPSVEGMIRNDLASQIARAEDLAGLSGTGGAGQPVGILNTSGVNTTALGTVGATTYAEWNAFVTALDVDNALDGSLGWAMHPASKAEALAVKSGATSAAWHNVGYSMIDEQNGGRKDTILGYPAVTTSQMVAAIGTAGCATFGNFADLVIVEWGGLNLAASMEEGDSFGKDLTAIRVTKNLDFIVRHPVSFCINS